MGIGNKNLKIIAATSMTVFSLLTCFMGAYAWFNNAMNQETTSDGFSIEGGSALNIESAYAVRYDGNYGATATNLFKNPTIAMSEYDYIFKDRNVNTPLFLRLELSGFIKTNNLSITIPCTHGYKVDGTNNIANYLSNVVSAKLLRGLTVGGVNSKDTYNWSGDTVRNNDVKASYDGMLATTHAASSGTPFVVSSEEKNNSITLSMNASTAFADDYIITRDDVDRVVVFIGFDYHVTNNVNLVDDYIDSYNGAAHSLSFADDIGTIALSNGD